MTKEIALQTEIKRLKARIASLTDACRVDLGRAEDANDRLAADDARERAIILSDLRVALYQTLREYAANPVRLRWELASIAERLARPVRR